MAVNDHICCCCISYDTTVKLVLISLFFEATIIILWLVSALKYSFTVESVLLGGFEASLLIIISSIIIAISKDTMRARQQAQRVFLFSNVF